MNVPTLAGLLRDNPVVVTGMGCYCAAGDSVEALWQAAMDGRSLAAWREFPMENNGRSRFAVCNAPEIARLPTELGLIRKADRCAHIAALAATQAWKQASAAGAYLVERVGVMMGSSRGPLGKITESFRQLGNGGPLPSLSAQSSMGSLAGALAQLFKLKGPSAVVSATCASSAFAMALAAEQLLLGKADAMLVGGAEAPLHAVILTQLESAGVLGSHEDARQICRPFDAARNGIVLGEGSAFFVLERAADAQRRGSTVLARFAGWSTSIDSFGRTGIHEDGSGLFQVMAGALDLAGLSPNAIDYINAHGTGTVVNDSAEAQAVSRLFGNRKVPCRSTKPITGHCLGATPVLEAILCIEALRRQEIPPSVNCSQQDPRCPIHLAGEAGRRAKLTSVMSNSLGFWGYHAALIFSKAGALADECEKGNDTPGENITLRTQRKRK